MVNEMKTIPFGKPIISEKELQEIKKVLDSGILTHGQKVKEFEAVFAEFCGTKYAFAVNSCTAALHLTLMAIDIKPGDEVIVPAMTHTATAHVVEFCGAKPVFADISLETGNIDLNDIKNKLTAKTKAIEVVHFLGLACPMDEINLIAQERNIPVVEDCALALGATYKGKKTGSLGISGSFSFYPIKHITTTEGGMLTTSDEKVAALAAKQRAFGIDKNIGERKIPGIYDVKYLGYNYRMSEIQAVMGLVQMQAFSDMNQKRQKNAKKLREMLQDVQGIKVMQDSGDETFVNANYCLNIVIDKEASVSRDEAVGKLNTVGVGTSVYYGTPVPLMSYYKNKYGHKAGDFPNAEKISNESIALPVGAHLDESDMEYIANAVSKVF